MQERPQDIAKLYVYRAESGAMQVVCNQHDPTEIVHLQDLRLVPAFMIHVLCQDEDAAFALSGAWRTYCETSPHRPRTDEELSAWSEKLNPYPNVPRDWSF
jgi:hypothetical protein